MSAVLVTGQIVPDGSGGATETLTFTRDGVTIGAATRSTGDEQYTLTEASGFQIQAEAGTLVQAARVLAREADTHTSLSSDIQRFRDSVAAAIKSLPPNPQAAAVATLSGPFDQIDRVIATLRAAKD